MPFGKYELLSRLRVGGMAEVWRAQETDPPGRTLALKRILPSFTDEADYVAMFIDEARLGLRLSHPGIVRAHELGQVDDEHYIALELVEGQDLAALIRHARERKEPVSPAIACRIAIAMCDALHYAHELSDAHGAPLGIVHRDVSPQNVLVSYEGDVKLIDFGIAKSTEQLMRTQAGLLKGKHGYLSPEQAHGQSVDRRSDLFSLGICLYELLAARRLFQGSSDFSTLVKVRNAEIPALETLNRDIPVELATIVHRALARERGARFQTALELQRALLAVVEQRGLACDRATLGRHMRERFARDGNGASESAPQPRDENTGLLAAFDELEPPTALSALSKMPADQPPVAVVPELVDADDPPVREGWSDDARADDDELLDDEADAAALASHGAAPALRGGAASEEPLRARRPTPSSDRLVEAAAERDTARPSVRELPTRVVAYESTHDGQLAAGPADDGATPALRGGASSDPTRVDRRTPQVGSLQRARDPRDRGDASSAAPGSDVARAAQPNLGELGLEWADEELSTQIYDPPAGEESVVGAAPSRRADETPAPRVARLTPTPTRRDTTPSVVAPPPAAVSAAPTPRVTMSSAPPRSSMPARHEIRPSAAPTPRVSVPAMVGAAPALRGGAASESPVPRSSVPPSRVSLPPPGALPSFGAHPELRASMPPMGSNRASAAPMRSAALTVQGPSRTTLGWAAAAAAMIVALVVAGVSWFGRPAPAMLHVTTDPMDAVVTVDGIALSGTSSPFVATELAPDVDHDVEVSRAGYRSWRTRLRLRAGKVTALPMIQLQREAATTSAVAPGGEGTASARSVAPAAPAAPAAPLPAQEPPGAGQRRAPPRNHVRSPGTSYAAPETRPARETRPAPSPSVVAPPPSAPAQGGGSGKGVLRVNSRPWSRVYIDGRLVGNTPQMQLALSPGWHTITLVNPDFGLQKVLTIRVRAGEIETKIVDLAPK